MNPGHPACARGWLWTGAVFERADAIPISDRGFRYGMSVFESLPVRKGVPLFLEEHLARLRKACAATELHADKTALAAIHPLLENSGDGFARIYVTAGDGPVTGPLDAGRTIVFIEPREPVPARMYHRGYDLRAHAEPHFTSFGGLKTANYWANLAAFREGVASQCNESLLFNATGHLISACMANVFVALDGKLVTPPLADGARDGVVREWVMRQTSVAEVSLNRTYLRAADEIFLTSSWLGIMPAASIDGRPLPSYSNAAMLRPLYLAATGPTS